MDWLDVLWDWDYYARHWRGFVGLALLIGGLVLAFGPTGMLAVGLAVAGIGFCFIIWEILTWFDREHN